MQQHIQASRKNVDLHSNESSTNEPSMEEILFSIRSVISGMKDAPLSNDADAPSDHARAKTSSPHKNALKSSSHLESDSESDVLELTEIVPDNSNNAPTQSAQSSLARSTAPTNKQPQTASLSVLEQIDKALENISISVKESSAAKLSPSTPTVSATKPAAAITPKEAAREAAPAILTTPTSPLAESSFVTSSFINAISDRTLLANKTTEQATESLKKLVRHLPDNNERQTSTPTSGIALEELVVKSIQPYLAEWMNANLPQIVERVVEKEVKRLVLNTLNDSSD